MTAAHEQISIPGTSDMDLLRARLQKIAQELLEHDAASTPDADGNTSGVTFYQVRWAAENRGWMTDTQTGLDFGSTVMKMAGGVPCEYRQSKHKNARHRPVRVFRLPIVAKR